MRNAIRDLSDAVLVELAREGDARGFAELYRRHRPKIRKIIFLIVKDEEIAEDFTQEVFRKAFDSLDTLKNPSRIRSWLLTVGGNLAKDYARKRKRKKNLDPVSLPEEISNPTFRYLNSISSPSSSSSSSRRKMPPLDPEVVRRYLEQLRPEYRRAFKLKHVEERSYDTIAERMRIPIGTAKTFVHRAKKKLQAVLGAKKKGKGRF